jgi:hypothetical protein
VKSATIGPYHLRTVLAHSKGKLLWGRRTYIRYYRIEATLNGTYIFSWPTWRQAERWCRAQIRKQAL